MKKVYGSDCKTCPIQEHKLECTTYEFCNKSLLEHDAKIRADVIDEFLKKDKECQQNNNVCPYMYSDISCIECIAKELKEQK